MSPIRGDLPLGEEVKHSCHTLLDYQIKFVLLNSLPIPIIAIFVNYDKLYYEEFGQLLMHKNHGNFRDEVAAEVGTAHF